MEEKRRIRMKIAYDGTDFAGWQRQNNGLAVQQVLEEAVQKLFHEEVTFDASGRTDAGVHARGQVAAITLRYPIPVDRLMLALNSQLPPAVRVLTAEETDASFHPQYQAKRKTYRYSWYNGRFMLPQYRLYMHHIHEPMDLARMQEACDSLLGEHDFEALSSAQRTVKTTVRTIYSARIFRDPADPLIIHLEVCGNGFLYNMVRIIAGTLADIGRHRLETDIFERAMKQRDRTILGMTSPACGLCLMDVQYGADAKSAAEAGPVVDTERTAEAE